MVIILINITVKVLDWGQGSSAENAALRSSFRQEVAVWYKLDHPNVTKVPTTFLYVIMFQF